MKKLKTIALLLFATTLTLSSCGDDDDNTSATTRQITGQLTFSGKLTTKISFTPETGEYTDYTSDYTDAKLTLESDGSITIVIDKMTARPGTGENPPSMMTDIIIKNVIATRLSDGSYKLSIKDEDFAGIAGGTMNDKFSTYRQGTVSGTFIGNTLKLNISGYKFTTSPYEPVMKSEFTGTIK